MNLKYNLIQQVMGELRNKKKVYFLMLHFLFKFYLFDDWFVVNHPLCFSVEHRY